jgi:hypothetical protein
MNSNDALITLDKLFGSVQLLKDCFTDEYLSKHNRTIDIYSKMNSLLYNIESLLEDLDLPSDIDLANIQAHMDEKSNL